MLELSINQAQENLFEGISNNSFDFAQSDIAAYLSQKDLMTQKAI